MNPPDALRARVLAIAAQAPSPTRSEGRRRALVVYALAVAVNIAVFETFGGVAHADGRPLALTGAIAAGAVVLAGVVAATLAWRRASMVGPSPLVLAIVTAGVPAITFAWMVAWAGRYVEPFARLGVRCFALTMIVGGAMLAASVLVRRRTSVRAPRLEGAAIGAGSGAWGAVAVDLWCPLTNAPHVAVGHVLPLVALAVVGAIAGQHVLRVRRRESVPQ